MWNCKFSQRHSHPNIHLALKSLLSNGLKIISDFLWITIQSYFAKFSLYLILPEVLSINIFRFHRYKKKKEKEKRF